MSAKLKIKIYIVPLTFFLIHATILQGQNDGRRLIFDFLGDELTINGENPAFVPFETALSQSAILEFYQKLNSLSSISSVKELVKYRDDKKLDDWLYYQLVRKTAQQISPKAENYYRYTLYKWFFLVNSGYDAIIRISDSKILFYVQSDDNIYNIPYRIENNKQYVCLNYHDYISIDFEKEKFTDVAIKIPGAVNGFSYKVSHLPLFNQADYQERDLKFNYHETTYRFKIKLNQQIKNIFANYPAVDYESYFNIPVSKETYSSLIPALQENLKGMSIKNGVDYLMYFTRDAFLFKPDNETFGKEKRLTPEQTLLYDQSDCEDRAAFFFYLVKEIYNLPMIVLTFSNHVTIAVKFDKPVGKPIVYNGEQYSVCEPTPQKKVLRLGQLLPELSKATYEVAYAYNPKMK